MYLRSNSILIMGLLLAITLLVPIFAYADSRIQGRPTRLKDFDYVDELKDYLNFVKDYYNLKGKARYGKRGGLSRNMNVTPNYSRELFRSKFNNLDEVFEKIQSNVGGKKKSSRNAFSLERYSESYNKHRTPYQISRLKLLPNFYLFGKSNGSRK